MAKTECAQAGLDKESIVLNPSSDAYIHLNHPLVQSPRECGAADAPIS